MAFRGVSNSDGDLRYATISAGLEDLDAALNYIKTLSWVESLALCGNSYGGQLAIMEASKNPSKYKFLILLSPGVGFSFIPNLDAEKWRCDGFAKILGFDMHYSMYVDICKNADITLAKNINIPTLIVHGDNDEILPLENSIQLSELIKSAKLVVLKDCLHQYAPCGKLIDALTAVNNFIRDQNE